MMTAIEAIRRASGEQMFFMANLSLTFEKIGCDLRRVTRNFVVLAVICLSDFRPMLCAVPPFAR
jgi:hypothetical protein